MVVRTVDPAIRLSLLARLGVSDESGLRSFLDKPKTPGVSMKGTGEYKYLVTKRNHTTVNVEGDEELKTQVHTT